MHYRILFQRFWKYYGVGIANVGRRLHNPTNISIGCKKIGLVRFGSISLDGITSIALKCIYLQEIPTVVLNII